MPRDALSRDRNRGRVGFLVAQMPRGDALHELGHDPVHVGPKLPQKPIRHLGWCPQLMLPES
jgi:hypothetical protein